MAYSSASASATLRTDGSNDRPTLSLALTSPQESSFETLLSHTCHIKLCQKSPGFRVQSRHSEGSFNPADKAALARILFLDDLF